MGVKTLLFLALTCLAVQVFAGVAKFDVEDEQENFEIQEDDDSELEVREKRGADDSEVKSVTPAEGVIKKKKGRKAKKVGKKGNKGPTKAPAENKDSATNGKDGNDPGIQTSGDGKKDDGKKDDGKKDDATREEVKPVASKLRAGKRKAPKKKNKATEQ